MGIGSRLERDGPSRLCIVLRDQLQHVIFRILRVHSVLLNSYPPQLTLIPVSLLELLDHSILARSYLPSNESYSFPPVNKRLAETPGNLVALR